MGYRSVDRGEQRRTDEELFREFKSGDDYALATLIKRYERELHNYLCRYLNDAALADDVFQNTWLQIHLKADAFQEGRLLRPWLYTIATHQAVDALRKLGRNRMVSLDLITHESESGEPTDLTSMTRDKHVEDPSQHAVTEENKVALRAALDRMSSEYRSIILLSYYQGLKYREIAEVLHIPLGTVKSRLSTAVKKLGQDLQLQTLEPEFRRAS
jgi:RNA polymerase sigma-70 factor (ECF subfamily)